jgi:acyl dehydratase
MLGRYFEDMDVGAEFNHPFTRTVTEMDNVLFTSLTMNPAPLHLDAEYAKTLPYGRPLVNSLFTVALIGGMTVTDLVFGTSLGNLGYEHIEFPKPVFHGDTIHAASTILDKRESKSNPKAGIVWFEHRGYNQRDEMVCLCKRVGMIMKRPVE